MRRLSRRQWLLAMAATVGAGALWWQQSTPDKCSDIFLSPGKLRTGKAFVAAFNAQGELRYRLTTAEEYHGVALSPQRQEALVVPTQDALPALLLEVSSGALKHALMPPADCHFTGHACVSKNGERLFTAENAFHQGVGQIGVWQAQSGKRLGAWSSGGVGPHELGLLSDNRTLVVANGGIKTHPDSGKQELNVADFSSSLTYLDSHNGQVLESHALANRQLSIRHLAINARDQVVAIFQYKGPKGDLVPLLGVHQRGWPKINLFDMPDESTWWKMQNYTASVCFNATGRQVVVSCPRGHLLTLWDVDTRRFIRARSLRDPGGVAPHPRGGWLLSAASGQLYDIEAGALTATNVRQWSDVHWGNHMAAMKYRLTD
jgi:uncharacterized protein